MEAKQIGHLPMLLAFLFIEEGVSAALRAEPLSSNPYAVYAEQACRWRAGWTEGYATLMDRG